MLSSSIQGFLYNVSRKLGSIRLNLRGVRLCVLSSGVFGTRLFLMNVRAKKFEKLVARIIFFIDEINSGSDIMKFHTNFNYTFDVFIIILLECFEATHALLIYVSAPHAC